jgi:two-component system CheB/CheR fusion protein
LDLLTPLRDWQQRSLGHSFMLSAASLALISVVLIASISVAVLYWTERQAVRTELHHKGQVATESVADPIQVMARALSELARSAMFTTAVLDSGDRAAHARPFLLGYSFPVPAANGLVLCDINGMPLAGTRDLANCHANTAEFGQVLADGKTRQMLIKTPDGRRLWTIFEGVTFVYTGTIEGVAVAQLDLDQLLRPLPERLGLASLSLRPRLARASQASASEAANWLSLEPAPLVAPLSMDAANTALGSLELVLKPYPQTLRDKLWTLLAGYFIAALALILAVIYWARRRSRTLIDPLLALRNRAQAIAETNDLTLPIPKGGIDEVGQLAEAIDSMVRAIRSADATRKEAQERFRLVFETSSEAAFFAWPDGRIESANAEALRLFGYTLDEVRTLGRAGVMDVSDPRLGPALEQRARTGSFRGELRCQRKDGSLFPAEVVSTIFHDSNGEVRSSSMFRDITERIEGEKRLKALSKNLVEVQEKARRHLASELHDRTSANLAAIVINMDVAWMSLQAREWQVVAERMGDNRALVEDTSASIREICAELRPPALDYAGLIPAIESYANLFTHRTGIAIQINNTGHEEKLTPEIKSNLFRIVQEALTNVAKHAAASMINIELALDGPLLRLSVADDGSGFELARLDSHGLGIINMREMAEFSGGSFYLASTPGGGTRISVELPIAEKPA